MAPSIALSGTTCGMGLVLAGLMGACSGDETAAPAPGTSASVARFSEEMLASAATRPVANVMPEVRAREIRYTRSWLDRLMRPPVLEAARDDQFRCLDGVGPRGDDAVAATWKIGDVLVEVVDSRVLVLSLRGPLAGGASGAFERFVDYGRHARPGAPTFRVLGGEAGVGTIEIDRKGARGWFAEPIVWSVPGARIVFVVEKTREPPSSKAAYPPERAADFVDGIAPSDPRAYRRFLESNREVLARERFSKRRPPPSSGAKSSGANEGHGRPIGLPVGR